MVNNEFKLQFYFNLYKDTAVISREEFVKQFRKKHGKFECMRELLFMIEEYQREKFNNLIDYYVNFDYGKKKRR